MKCSEGVGALLREDRDEVEREGLVAESRSGLLSVGVVDSVAVYEADRVRGVRPLTEAGLS